MAVSLAPAVYQQVMVRFYVQVRMPHLPHCSSHLGFPARLNRSMAQLSLPRSGGI